MADIPVPEFRKYRRQNLALLKSESHAIRNKYSEETAVVRQVYEVLSYVEILTGCTPVEVGESSEWTSIMNSAEENRANFCKSSF
jgi:hypothetical protein